MSVKKRSTLGNKLMNFYCVLAQRDPVTARSVSENINGPAWKNIQSIPKNIDTAMGSPIISIFNKEAMIFFVNYHERHFNKYDKVSATVSIDTKKI